MKEYLKNMLSIIMLGAERIIYRRKQPALVLCYHSVSSDNTLIDITRKNFEKQLSYLSKHYEFVSLETIGQYFSGKITLDKPSIALTFDDGYKDILKSVVPTLKKGHIPATFFVMSTPKNVNRLELENKKQLLSLTDILKLSRDGFEIGCHTATHADLSVLGKTRLTQEIVHSKTSLEKLLKKEIRYFAYPKGITTPEAIALCKTAGYHFSFTTDVQLLGNTLSPHLMPRIGIDRTLNDIRFQAKLTHLSIWYFMIKPLLKGMTSDIRNRLSEIRTIFGRYEINYEK